MTLDRERIEKERDRLVAERVRPVQEQIAELDRQKREWPDELEELLDEAAELSISGDNPERLDEVQDRIAFIERERPLIDRKRSKLKGRLRDAQIAADVPKLVLLRADAIEAVRAMMESFAVALADFEEATDARRRYASAFSTAKGRKMKAPGGRENQEGIRQAERELREQVGPDPLNTLGLAEDGELTDGLFEAMDELVPELVAHFRSPARS